MDTGCSDEALVPIMAKELLRFRTVEIANQILI